MLHFFRKQGQGWAVEPLGISEQYLIGQKWRHRKKKGRIWRKGDRERVEKVCRRGKEEENT